MKSLLTLLVFWSLLMFGCSPDSPEMDVRKAEYNFYITGISESLSYTFSPSNGRQVNTVPEDVKMLVILIFDAVDDLVYQQYYFNYGVYYEDSVTYKEDGSADYYYFENTIPDTLFIPKLPEGDYTILAATSDIFNYYRYYDNVDSINYHGDISIYSGAVSEGPIYVGKQSFTLTEEAQRVVMDMNNISARIGIERVNGSSENWVDVVFSTRDNHYYSFDDNAFHINEYDFDERIYLYTGPSGPMYFYVLPKTLTAVSINFYNHYNGAYFSQEVDLDPDMTLTVGDAINFTIDEAVLMEGGGRGTFNWEAIEWNDLGSIDLP